jgi:hypothetical protein
VSSNPPRLEPKQELTAGNPLLGSIVPAVFCPECKAEYRSGFNHCGSNCGRSGAGTVNQIAWNQELKDAGIPLGPRSGMGVDRRFEIIVPQSLRDRARQVLNENPDESVELSLNSHLDTNLIRFRSERQADGKVKVFPSGRCQ